MKPYVYGMALFLCLVVSACSVSGALPGISSGSAYASSPSSIPPSPAQPIPSRTLTVYAASSLIDAFQELGMNFEAEHPGVRVQFNFANSQVLRTQLEQGAVGDIFASADNKNMDLLDAQKLIQPGSSREFATNSLVVILPADNPAGIKTLHDLARPGVKLVLADESVPAGSYSLQVLSSLRNDPNYGELFEAAVKENIVSFETNVRQVVTKVELAEGDAGIVYASDAIATPDLVTIAIPVEHNITARYPVAILATTLNLDLADDFISFVTSPGGQVVLERWGFSPME